MNKQDKLRLIIINLILLVLAIAGVGFCALGRYLVAPAIIIMLISFVAGDFARRAINNKTKYETLRDELKSINDYAHISDPKNPSEMESRIADLATKL